MRRLRSAMCAAIGALVCLSAAGCVSIPDSSGVGQASEVGVTDQSPQIVNVAQGPAPGAKPETIVYGFYNAMLAYPRSVDVERQFLTPDAAGSWDPDASVTVYEPPTTVVPHGDRSVTVTAQTSGWLDARGSWTSSRASAPSGSAAISPHSTRSEVNLRLEKVAGEWRIANPPDGSFVSTDYFSRYYSAYSLYFFDPSRSILAPDPVYLPVGDTAPTALVKGLLQGPTADLRDAVYTAAPAGTQLEVSVSVSRSGVAEVPLSTELQNPATDRQLFAAQLAWTLRQIPEIQRIKISVDGTPFPIENTGLEFAADGFAAYDPAGLAGERRLFALSAKGPVTVSSSGVVRVPGPIGRVTGRSMAVQTSGQLAAIVMKDGQSISVGPIASGTATESAGVAPWLSNGSDLLRPSWDARQVLWLVDQPTTGAPRILVMTGPNGRYSVEADWLAGRRIDAFSVSRDGVRFAAIIERSDGVRQLVISTIMRGPGGPRIDPVSLAPPELVQNTSRTFDRLVDLAWFSPTSIAVLGSEAGGGLQTYEVAIDGSEIESAGGILPANATPVSIAAGPNTDAPIAIATRQGAVEVQGPDLTWSGVTDPSGPLHAAVYPG
jgi:hypothetical protein